MKWRFIVAKYDGIGPEIMEATLAILAAANARAETEEMGIGKRSVISGFRLV